MKKKVLFEDAVSMYNRWVSGQASREFGSIKMKYDDLIGTDKGYKTQSPNNARASNVLPYPIPNTVSILGDLISNTTSAINNFNIALKNPIVQKDKKAQKELELVVGCLNNSLEELRQIFVVINKSAEDA